MDRGAGEEATSDSRQTSLLTHLLLWQRMWGEALPQRRELVWLEVEGTH